MIGNKPSFTETHLNIKGVVQGVFFRRITKQHADQLGIKGYVCNLRNGDVKICITEGNVEELLKCLKQEPPPIHIHSIERAEHPLHIPYSSFEIKNC